MPTNRRIFKKLSKYMKILVIGVGGIGGFIGSYLVNNNYDVTFIARKKDLIFKTNGLNLKVN